MTAAGRQPHGKREIAFEIFAGLALLAILASLVPTDFWLVRSIDLVREPLVFLCTALGIAAFFIVRCRRWLIVGAFGLAALINLWRMWPYLAIAPAQIASIGAPGAADDACFSAMSINVKQENRDFAPVLEQIRLADPDILLLMETDQRWLDALAPVLTAYPTLEEYPLDNAYGMAFATRLPFLEGTYVENTSRDTPTFYGAMALPGGGAFEFIGLHPKPPLPGQSTAKRDANIARAGSTTPRKAAEAIVMGDFNDVPWSRTTAGFREAGGWRDPRIGRGAYPTFPAGMTWLGWPLDQLMVKGDLTIKSFEVMEQTSADHRAMLATICAVEP
ncbi:endonuclease/exonuclease/phosphatase family protein [Paraurantiacibacter namhicola]|uniref:Endonuclease/exonuclease/phosphatase domain-containing protein n=1 Tax=Paraurantiacibacter namhicola TaxID=645517 RepID=A0A1C7D533_9SPHN|nr:endonuclease/exonuclease/phosphatase family protein [Paraurantiacibacter namhicola]ANU06413.1 hypothetical protein A6F65_00085 [Paraurantiacibacter namhicola]